MRRLLFDVTNFSFGARQYEGKTVIVGEGGLLSHEGAGVIHVMTHDPGCGVKGNGRCEIELPTPRSLAAPVNGMLSVCASYLATRWLAVLHAD